MWALLFITVTAGVLIVSRHLFLTQSGNLNTPLFANKVRTLLLDKKADEAVRLCDAGGKRAFAWVAKGAIVQAESDPARVRTVVEERVVSIIPRLEKRLIYIATLGNLSTMIGLMGTIYGLILSFAAVGAPNVDPAMKSSMLAQGISAAMNTTLAGLIIAIPCILFYTGLKNRANRIVAEIDQYIIPVIRILCPEESIGKSYKPSERKTKEMAETEPNLIPIMGLMVVLIPLLLSSAEFVKMGRATVNLPQASGEDSMDEPEQKIPPKTLNLGLEITRKGIRILHSLKPEVKPKTDTAEPVDVPPDIPVLSGGQQDYATLNTKLLEVKRQAFEQLLGNKGDFESLYIKFTEAIKKTDFYDYKDLYNVKILADSAISYQTIISVMDAARNFRDKEGNKLSLFPVVSMGVKR